MRNITPMRTAKIGYIVMSVIFILGGITMIAAPDISAEVICSAAGICAAVFGAVKLVSYFSKDLFRLAFQFDLAAGILLLILGTAMAARPRMFLGMIGFIFGIGAMADGLLKIQTALDAKAFGVSKWWLILAAAIITGIVGLMLTIDPLSGASAAAVLMGISLLAEGILNLITVLTAVKIVRHQHPDSDDVITVSAVQYR